VDATTRQAALWATPGSAGLLAGPYVFPFAGDEPVGTRKHAEEANDRGDSFSCRA
jgi:hypothetical protein